MSSGNFHEGFNTAFLSIAFIILILVGVSLSLHAIFFLECCLFWIHGYFHTFYATPDLDTKSNSTKKLGLIGKIINFIFPHRGLLHNPAFWIGIYLLIGSKIYIYYNYIIWWCSGGILAIFSHLIVDDLSTGKKRLLRKIRKAIPFMRFV